jgi:hypothetical protein
MAYKRPNIDLDASTKPSSIAWDKPDSSLILDSEFFEAAPVVSAGAAAPDEIFRDRVTSGGASAYSSTDVVVGGSTGSMTFSKVSESLLIAGPTSGKVQANGVRDVLGHELFFYPSPINSNLGTFNVELIWRYRQYGSSTWIDLGSATSSTVPASVYYEDPEYLASDGTILVPVVTATGLTQGVVYEFALFGRRTSSSPSKSMTFYGSGAVVAEIIEPLAPAVGSVSAQEGLKDTVASTGSAITLTATGSASATEVGADTLSGTGVVVAKGASSVSEGSTQDGAASTGAVIVKGSSSVADGATGDTTSASGSTVAQGSASAAEQSVSDTVASTGSAAQQTATGSASAAESAADVSASQGSALIQGAAGATEANKDIVTASGNAAVLQPIGSASITETGADTAASAGTFSIVGASAATEAASDALAAPGKLPIAASASSLETAGELAVSAGKLTATGSTSVADGTGDTLASIGTLLSSSSGSASATESATKDIATATGVAYKATDSTFNGASTTSFVAISDILSVYAPSSGKVQLSATLTTSVAPAGAYGEFEVQMVWRYRPIAGTFVDAGPTVNSSPNALYSFDPEFSEDISEFGSIASSPLVTGLTVGVGYEFQLFARRVTSAPTKNVSFAGTASATPLGGLGIILGDAAILEGTRDTLVASTSKIATGAAASSESGQDVLAALGAMVISAAINATEGSRDSAAGISGKISYGLLSAAETGGDLLSADGNSPVVGAASAAEMANDSLASTGAVVPPARVGAASSIEMGQDTPASAGVLGAPVSLPSYFPQEEVKPRISVRPDFMYVRVEQGRCYLAVPPESNKIVVNDDVLRDVPDDVPLPAGWGYDWGNDWS